MVKCISTKGFEIHSILPSDRCRLVTFGALISARTLTGLKVSLNRFTGLHVELHKKLLPMVPSVSISSCQWNLMKTYHNDANPSGITKIASKKFFGVF